MKGWGGRWRSAIQYSRLVRLFNNHSPETRKRNCALYLVGFFVLFLYMYLFHEVQHPWLNSETAKALLFWPFPPLGKQRGYHLRGRWDLRQHSMITLYRSVFRWRLSLHNSQLWQQLWSVPLLSAVPVRCRLRSSLSLRPTYPQCPECSAHSCRSPWLKIR